MRKKQPDTPPAPKKFREVIVWFAAYHTGKFIVILSAIASLVSLVILACTLSFSAQRDKTGKMRMKEIHKERFEMEKIMNMKK